LYIDVLEYQESFLTVTTSTNLLHVVWSEGQHPFTRKSFPHKAFPRSAQQRSQFRAKRFSARRFRAIFKNGYFL